MITLHLECEERDTIVIALRTHARNLSRYASDPGDSDMRCERLASEVLRTYRLATTIEEKQSE